MYCETEHRCSECNRKRTIHIKRLEDTMDLSCAWGFVLIVCFLWQWRQLKKFLCSKQASYQLFLLQDQDAVRGLCKKRWQKPHWSPSLPFFSRPAFIHRSLPELHDDVSLLVMYVTDPDFDLIPKLVLGPTTSLCTHTVTWAVADPGYHQWMYFCSSCWRTVGLYPMWVRALHCWPCCYPCSHLFTPCGTATATTWHPISQQFQRFQVMAAGGLLLSMQISLSFTQIMVLIWFYMSPLPGTETNIKKKHWFL